MNIFTGVLVIIIVDQRITVTESARVVVSRPLAFQFLCTIPGARCENRIESNSDVDDASLVQREVTDFVERYGAIDVPEIATIETLAKGRLRMDLLPFQLVSTAFFSLGSTLSHSVSSTLVHVMWRRSLPIAQSRLVLFYAEQTRSRRPLFFFSAFPISVSWRWR